MNRQGRTPLFTGLKEDLMNYVGSLNVALFSSPNRFVPQSENVTGDMTGFVTGTGRHVDVSMTISGPTVSSGGTMTLPLRPLTKGVFRAVTDANPCVFLGDCLLGLDGLLVLPDWNVSDDVIVYGSVVEE